MTLGTFNIPLLPGNLGTVVSQRAKQSESCHLVTETISGTLPGSRMLKKMKSSSTDDDDVFLPEGNATVCCPHVESDNKLAGASIVWLARDRHGDSRIPSGWYATALFIYADRCS